jgi:hypothetical protein
MHTARTFGRLALTAAMLVLAACSSNPAAEPGATAIPVKTELPQIDPASSPAQTTPPESQPPESPAPSASSAPSASTAPSASIAPAEPVEPEEGMPPTALEAAKTVMRALKNGNMNTLSDWVSRDKGVRFSPYGYVDTKKDLVFTQEEIKGLMKDPAKRVWREFPGSGDLIKLTFAEYYKKFVYDADFMGQAEIALNKGLGQGSMVNNINEVYPADSYDFVEYYIDGVDPAAGGMDWRSLRLVFEKIGQDHILVGIVHDQWTP